MSADDRSMFHAGGPTGFLLIHGLSGTPVELRYVANGLARAGHTVSCPQLAGHCGTVEQLAASGWTDWMASVETALADLERRCDTIFVGGLSMGALLALVAAARHPKTVDGVVLYAPTLWLDGWGVPIYARLFSLVTQKWFADLLKFSERPPYGIKDRRLRAMVADALHSGDPSKAGFLTIPGGPMLELRWLVQEVKRQLAGIRQPVLMIHPREDDRASLANTVYLEKRLGGLVEKLVLDDSYHVITIDRQRDLVLARTSAFASWVGAARDARRSPAPGYAMAAE